MLRYISNLSLLIFIIFIISTRETEAQQKTEYSISNNIKYIDLPVDSYQDSICRLDLYYPKNKQGFATVIWYHGGGLTGGTKEIPYELKEKGFAVVGVGYRLSPRIKTPEFIRDAAQAAAWVVRNISRYGGDSTKIVLSGHSAGGYLALMVGMDSVWMLEYGLSNKLFAALVPLSGQCITHFTVRSERGIQPVQPVVDEYAPLFHVKAAMPEISLITGDRELELLGRYEENAYLTRMLKLNGKANTRLFELDGLDHVEMLRPGCILLTKLVREKFGMK